jgi:hypothetical protein
MIATSSSILKKDIQLALTELGNDREVFERAEINPGAMRRTVEKYGELIPASLFDYWFDKHQELNQRVEDLENQGKELLKFIQGYFKACIEASSVAGLRLKEIVDKHPCFSVNQIRADIDMSSQIVKIMVLLKGDWLETEVPSEKTMEQLTAIESSFFNLEKEFIHDYSFKLFESENKIQIRAENHKLLFDSRLDIDSLTKDFPISVRL